MRSSSLRFPSLFLGLILCTCFGLQARLFLPEAAPEKLVAGKGTRALYEVGREDFSKGEMRDVTGQAQPGRLMGKWEYVTPQELQPSYAGAALALGGTPQNQAVFEGLKGLGSGAFTIDVVMRWREWGGLGLQIGDDAGPGFTLSYSRPGRIDLRVPVRSADGAASVETLSSEEVYRETGQLRLVDFYTLSLSFDGQKTFRLFINGQPVWQGAIRTGAYAGAGDRLALGTVGKMKAPFRGELAAVRVSSQAMEVQPAAATEAAFVPQERKGWIFDAGPPDRPAAPGTIRLDSANRYKDAPRLGYGWLELAHFDFDAWYGPGLYRPTGPWAYLHHEFKAYDGIERDGVVMIPGLLFRVDVPDGRYWVTLEIGHNRGTADVASITANDVVLGENLRVNANTHKGAIIQRTARGIVTAKDGRGIVISGATTAPGGYIPIKSIGILPYQPLPVQLEKGALVWKGTGASPKELKAVNAALAAQDSAAALAAARAIGNPLVRANVMEIILGQPKLPDVSDLAAALEVRGILLGLLREQPENEAARWLYDSNERFRRVLLGYTDENGDEMVYGSKGDVQAMAADLGLSLRPEDPGYWQGRFLAAAAIWQNAVQGSSFGPTSETYLEGRGPKAFDAPGRYFKEITAAYPDFRLARIMYGEKLPMKSTWKAPASAPEWAALQYQLLHRILDTIHYWVNERMDESGLLGGGLGDDVEALRWWGPAISLADDPTTIKGFKKLSEAAWKSTKGAGFALQIQDVEHSAEDISDSQPLMALINYGTPDMTLTTERLTKMQPVFRDVWSTVTPDGHRMLKGHYLSATAVDREGDVPYNIRAIRPLLWAAWVAQGKNRELDDLLVAYAASWRDAIMSEFDGKPRGIVPMMIRTDRRTAKQDTNDGYLDKPLSWSFPGYWSYEYPAGFSAKVYDLLVAAYELSGDRSFLEPITFGLEAVRKIAPDDMDPAKYPEGSFDWAIRSAVPMLGLAGANYRIATGDTSYDDVLLRIAPPHTQFVILAARAENEGGMDQAVAPVLEKLRTDLTEMNSSPELRTTLIKSTDRIYVCGSQIIEAMATGIAASKADLRGGEVIWPFFQITWQGTAGQLAAMVGNASPSRLDVLLYSFADKPLDLRPRVWRLDPGEYRMVLTATDRSGFKAVRELSSRDVTITGAGQEVPFTLPPGVPARVSISRK